MAYTSNGEKMTNRAEIVKEKDMVCIGSAIYIVCGNGNYENKVEVELRKELADEKKKGKMAAAYAKYLKEQLEGLENGKGSEREQVERNIGNANETPMWNVQLEPNIENAKETPMFNVVASEEQAHGRNTPPFPGFGENGLFDIGGVSKPTTVVMRNITEGESNREESKNDQSGQKKRIHNDEESETGTVTEEQHEAEEISNTDGSNESATGTGEPPKKKAKRNQVMKLTKDILVTNKEFVENLTIKEDCIKRWLEKHNVPGPVKEVCDKIADAFQYSLHNNRSTMQTLSSTLGFRNKNATENIIKIKQLCIMLNTNDMVGKVEKFLKCNGGEDRGKESYYIGLAEGDYNVHSRKRKGECRYKIVRSGILAYTENLKEGKLMEVTAIAYIKTLRERKLIENVVNKTGGGELGRDKNASGIFYVYMFATVEAKPDDVEHIWQVVWKNDDEAYLLNVGRKLLNHHKRLNMDCIEIMNKNNKLCPDCNLMLGSQLEVEIHVMEKHGKGYMCKMCKKTMRMDLFEGHECVEAKLKEW